MRRDYKTMLIVFPLLVLMIADNLILLFNTQGQADI